MASVALMNLMGATVHLCREVNDAFVRSYYEKKCSYMSALLGAAVFSSPLFIIQIYH